MNKHKTKLFKKVFEANSDDVLNLEDQRSHVMTETTFVPLMGQMWDKAKEKYFHKRKDETLEFAEWAASNFRFYFMEERWHPYDVIYKKERGITTDEVFEIWKKEK